MAVEHSLLRRRKIIACRRCELTCGYPFPVHAYLMRFALIFNSVQHFSSSFSTYSSHAAVVPSRLLIVHPPASAQGTNTRRQWNILFWYSEWRWSILYLYTGWRWSILNWYEGWRWRILYWYTGWRWSILFALDVGVDDRSMEKVWVHMWLSFPYACIFTAFLVRFLFQSNISHRPSVLTLPMQL